MPESFEVPSRFNGPKGSGNGGYSAGVVAGLVGGEAEVSLRRPVPLDAELKVVRDGDGAVRVLDGEALVIEGASGRGRGRAARAGESRAGAPRQPALRGLLG